MRLLLIRIYTLKGVQINFILNIFFFFSACSIKLRKFDRHFPNRASDQKWQFAHQKYFSAPHSNVWSTNSSERSGFGSIGTLASFIFNRPLLQTLEQKLPRNQHFAILCIFVQGKNLLIAMRHSDLGKIKYLLIKYLKNGKTKLPQNLQKSNSA